MRNVHGARKRACSDLGESNAIESEVVETAAQIFNSFAQEPMANVQVAFGYVEIELSALNGVSDYSVGRGLIKSRGWTRESVLV